MTRTTDLASLNMNDDPDQFLSIDGYSENADFSSDSLVFARAPRPLQSAFDPAYARRPAASGRQDTAAADTAAPFGTAPTASIILFMMRQQQEQQELQARREEQQMRCAREYLEEHRQELLAERERRDRERREDYQQHREDAQQHRTDMMQMMSALAAQASAPPSPVRPIAVISTKSYTKLAELSSISSLRGMFDSEARYRDFFNVEDEHGTPVTNIVSAIDALRDTIKLHVSTAAPVVGAS